MHVPWHRGRGSPHSFVFLKPCDLFYLSWFKTISESLRGITDVKDPTKVYKSSLQNSSGRFSPWIKSWLWWSQAEFYHWISRERKKKKHWSTVFLLFSIGFIQRQRVKVSPSGFSLPAFPVIVCLVLLGDAVADPGCGLHQAVGAMLLRPPRTLSPLLQCRNVTRPHHPEGPWKFRSSIFMSCESSSKWEMYPLRDNTNIAHQRVGHRIFTILEKRHSKNLFRCFLNSQITLPADNLWLR